MTITFGSICTGGGLADVGAIAAGLNPIWGIELDPDIARVAEANLGHRVYAQSCINTAWNKLDKVDVLWASPPCPSFSVAKVNRKETAVDRAIAQSIVDAIKTLEPSAVILENVQGYAKSKSLQFIEGALYGLGYWIDRQVFNSADFGVPQTRKRLILRAVRGGFPKPLPPATAWKGWYEAIEDLIPTLPESQFAPWQLERLPDEVLGTILVEAKNSNQQWGKGFRDQAEPALTVVSDHKPSHAPKAFVVDGTGNGNGERVTVVDGDRPFFTVKAAAGKHASRSFLVHPTDQRAMPVIEGDRPAFTITSNQSGNHIKSWLEQGKVVSITPRALARFQSLPDWYQLPEKNALACKIIGNGVPCGLAQAMIESCI